jgi:predicted DNA-binding protein
MEDERYEDLRRFAFEKKVPMAELVRHAIEETFEDQLDGVAAQRGLEHYLKNPEDYVPLEDVLKELGIELPHRRPSRSNRRTEKAAS